LFMFNFSEINLLIYEEELNYEIKYVLLRFVHELLVKKIVLDECRKRSTLT